MSNATIARYNFVSLQTNRYVSVALLFFGIVGNGLCCIVFLQRALRTNPCVMYFLIACISNLISLISGIPPRMLSNWNILPDRTETVSAFCRSRIFVLFVSKNIASWLLALATIDRYLLSSSNANIRRLSSPKQAIRWILIVCTLSIGFWAESIYCFDANLVGTPIKCYAKSGACRIFNDLAQSFVTTIIASSIMLIFGLLTISNIRQTRVIQPSMANNAQVRRRKTDHNLTRMLFLQVILLTIFNLPQAAQKFYLTATFYQPKSSVQTAFENLLFNIVLLFTYIPSCMPFYLYILSSEFFRQKLTEVIRTIVQRLKCTRN